MLAGAVVLFVLVMALYALVMLRPGWGARTSATRWIVLGGLCLPALVLTPLVAYALITGVKHGWLDANEYGDVARRGWIGLCSKLDETGALRDVCVGTNQKDDTQYYLDRPRATGDLHGQSPMLWCAAALLEQSGKK